MKGRILSLQLFGTADVRENVRKALRYIEEACRTQHPDLVLLPEVYLSSPVYPTSLAADSPEIEELKEAARAYGIYLVFGYTERIPASHPDHALRPDGKGEKGWNSVMVIAPDGQVLRNYHKTHMYDAFRFKESDSLVAGDALFEPFDTPFGRIGLFTCYEVRFPEIARYEKSRGADIILMPTAWQPGKLKSLHFNTLIKARAIENTAYLIACDQCGKAGIGESLSVDPMGVVLAAAGEDEQAILAEVDMERVREVSNALPSWENKRTELYKI